MSDTLELRDLSLDDIADMLELEERCYRTPWSHWMLAAELSRDGGFAIGSWSTAGKLVAMLIAARLADAWHILNVAVSPGHRRRGVASGLLEVLLARTAGDGSLGYTLEVRRSNTAAIELYERHGFEPAGVRPRYYEDREDALIMWRPPQAVLDARDAGAAPEWEPPQ